MGKSGKPRHDFIHVKLIEFSSKVPKTPCRAAFLIKPGIYLSE